MAPIAVEQVTGAKELWKQPAVAAKHLIVGFNCFPTAAEAVSHLDDPPLDRAFIEREARLYFPDFHKALPRLTDDEARHAYAKLKFEQSNMAAMNAKRARRGGR